MKKVLLIDDDSAIHLIASAALKEAGVFHLDFARTGRQGLERARANNPDLILLDYMLPDLDGDQVIRPLREDEKLEDTPVLFLTAKGEQGLDYKALGAQGLITKPFDLDTLADQIRSILQLPDEPAAAPTASGDAEALLSGEPFDHLSRSFVEDGLREIAHLVESVGPKFDIDAARWMAHRWIGSGGTLGHPRITLVARLLELRLAEGCAPENRGRLQSDLREVQQAFQEAWGQFDSPRQEPTADAAAVAAVPHADGEPPRTVDLPDDVRQVMGDRGVGVFGFDDRATEATREMLHTANATVKPGVELSARLERYDEFGIDAAVVRVADDHPEASWSLVGELLRRDIATLIVGSGTRLLATAPPGAGCDVLLAPWSAEEIMLRTYRLIAHASARMLLMQVAEDPDEQQAPSGTEVVVAADDPTITALVEMTLRDVGLTCHIAGGGQDALDLVEQVRPAAVVLDINMPQMNGFEVLAALRNEESTRSLPIVMLTARRQETDVIRGFRLGADDYVIKPFNRMELGARVERLIRRAS